MVAVSNAEIAQYKNEYINDDKIVKIPNGIDLNNFNDIPISGMFRATYNFEEAHIILFVGRINKRKGLGFLIKSFYELKKELNNLLLVIIGPDDGYKKELEKLILSLNLNGMVKFLGYVTEISKLSAYVDADVVVYPGTFEIFGLVPFEAIMCGTPVIVTNDCGCGEYVESSGGGYIVKYGDDEGLKEQLKRVIENPEEGKQVVDLGKKYILDFLAWDKVVGDYITLYREVMG